MIRRLLSILIVFIVMLVFPLTALAAIATPDLSWSIYSVNGYRNIREANDAGFLVTFFCDYTVNPTEGTLTDLFLVRLLTAAGAEFRSVTAYSYFNSGYDYAVAWIYFSAAEVIAKALVYATVDYQVRVEGNPTLSWTATPPPVQIFNTIDYDLSTNTTDTKLAMEADIRSIGAKVQTEWGGATTGILTTTTSGIKLDNVEAYNGEAYFTNVIAGLQAICPELFLIVVTTPTVPEMGTTVTNLTTMENRLVGTTFDMTDLAFRLSVPRLYLSTAIWFILMALISYAVCLKVNSYKIFMPIMAVSSSAGLFLGFTTWQAGILVMIVSAIMAVFIMQRST